VAKIFEVLNLYSKEIIKKLSASKKIAVLTGAGISAESGIATFRAVGGRWNNVDPMKVATAEAFEKDPKYVWEWYEARRREVAAAEPNRGHEVIAWMEEFFPQVILVTQNVDRLHHQAGSRNPIELHGSLWMVRCTGKPSCGEWEDRHELVNLPPKCPQCGALLRPGVVWFGEAMPFLPWDQAEQAAKDCDILFVIGTSALVYPAAALPEEPLRRGKLVIEINPEETPLSGKATFSVRFKAGEALELLQEALINEGPESNL
jgi:NAD-dependent deacetylase